MDGETRREMTIRGERGRTGPERRGARSPVEGCEAARTTEKRERTIGRCVEKSMSYILNAYLNRLDATRIAYGEPPV